MKVSSQLTSQTISKYVLSWLLNKIGRTKWTEKYNSHDLVIEAWANGVWVKQAGIISYKNLAEALRLESQAKAHNLSVQKVSKGFLVSSFQDNDRKYFVSLNNKKWTCNCMRYGCWNHRMEKELPQLYKALNNKVFCHHIVAAYDYQKFLKS